MDKVVEYGALKKARDVFERFRKHLDTEQEQAGAVQAFKFCYELSWRMMKKYLLANGQQCGSPKDTFRRAFEEGLIEDPEIWFGFQKKRNLTVHTYNMASLELIIESFDEFSKEMNALISRLVQ